MVGANSFAFNTLIWRMNSPLQPFQPPDLGLMQLDFGLQAAAEEV